MSANSSASLSTLEFTLLNAYQRGFPLLPRPFAALATQLDTDEQTVIGTLQRLQQRGMISRVGAVFRPNVIGVSTLAALAVPTARVEEVATIINGHPEVNHNYEREHHFNLWFVATAPSAELLRGVLEDIESASTCGSMLVLPMLEDYHIDLGFDLAAQGGGINACRPARRPCHAPLSAPDRQLIAALQDGLPLVAHPFAQLGMPEKVAIATIARWLDEGVIKRFGVVVRHHELGYTANAMAVWDLPDGIASEFGRCIAATGKVTLCYRRQRQLPEWHYNLFCMVHGKDRAEVEASVAALIDACGLAAYPHALLFSRRRFKQHGARYAPLREAVHG
ncbi:MAG TPA: Lrp/AsnC family transcriptional regulator [Noviherbaspirillum sp.]|uniref:siroheme decarboxylase subunit beta n=1 Tax=Noviherbaspirillum sp. TaxID=1926288 RepID=UPI002B476DB1|nr:Lrp/AsnC family transcriptional regulator [Noviherbaspirillum sp.]HJV84286.1 Lrp/AsnC family transcriptional regulator [Noviherbaspirillum sp.]